jgi:hypothetical protein
VKRLLHFLICIDQLCYSLITLGYASPIETMSAAAYRLEQEGRIAGKIFRPLIDALFWFDPLHCYVSYDNLKHLTYLPESYQR